MATTDLTTVFETLFTAPIQATVNAEASYRTIWAKWLEDLKKLVDARAAMNNLPPASFGAQQVSQVIQASLDLAPVMKLEASIETAVTLRIASVKKFEGGLELGIGVSSLQVSGSFGFMSQTSQESILQARAVYAIANTNPTSLKEYLREYSIPVETSADLATASSFLKS